jgi:hypothetical protein
VAAGRGRLSWSSARRRPAARWCTAPPCCRRCARATNEGWPSRSYGRCCGGWASGSAMTPPWRCLRRPCRTRRRTEDIAESASSASYLLNGLRVHQAGPRRHGGAGRGHPPRHPGRVEIRTHAAPTGRYSAHGPASPDGQENKNQQSFRDLAAPARSCLVWHDTCRLASEAARRSREVAGERSGRMA